MQLLSHKLKCEVNINCNWYVHNFYIDNMTFYIVEVRILFHMFLVFICMFDYHISFSSVSFFFSWTSYHKPRDLTQCIVIQFYSLEVCGVSHGDKIKLLVRLHSFLAALGVDLFPCLFLLLYASTFFGCGSFPPSSNSTTLHVSDHSSVIISHSDSLLPPSSNY